MSGTITITRDAFGNVVVEGQHEDGRAAGVAIFKDERDWKPALDYLMGKVL
jgi:hypothetical protein